ncbi:MULTISPECIES: UbiA-like polyprenyltransferase [Paenibacillus]|uniref:4-hydroxybenzoate polyprenyltransferase n=1 Tax=Paenibacillus campinasensis TaxID=66347 RepID=A0A268F2V5_9BACL|nr:MULTISPECIES: UbiA-like polyprenyltransferase [Paenibacillus]MUG65001.1 4-hydroxybenzoate octaprenyltransferase [Paenibacillus campinasensis]PAD79715.1 4-hydroxybenzoate octaprenyltransferase [Paenibacillus campinasensis]PAK53578.1 4-hydroxybenzoate octaprenyltransferase [Paenibacillus sp. 7541]
MFKKIRTYLEMIKVEHTLFALPFAFMGAILGSAVVFDHLPSWGDIGWIFLAMFGARSAAFGLNRITDKKIDAKNPRTAKRAIPAGLLKPNEVILFIIASFAVFFWATYMLDPFAFRLLPIAIFMLIIYSFTKRFTWLCHVVLGFTTALAPLGGWVAVTGQVDWKALLFYVALAFWTAGFDVIYACQDQDFDKKEGLYSIPSRFGLHKALWFARGFHVITAIGFIVLFFVTPLNWWYLIGMLIACGILFYQHYILSPNDMSRLQTAFFTMNSTLSIVLFVFTLIDLVVRYR